MTKKMLFVLTTLFFLTSLNSIAQEEVEKCENPISVGIKIGVPNLAGLNLEYVTPLLGGKLAGAADFSYIPVSSADADITILNWAVGVNYFFKKPGRGLYGGIATGSLNLDVTAYEGDMSGTATAKISFPLMVKLGAKLGKKFYFRTELGYGVISAPEQIEVTLKGGGQPDQIEVVEIPPVDMPIIFNLGFGFSF